MNKIIQLLLHKYKGLYQLTVNTDKITIEVSDLYQAEQISKVLKASLASANAFYANLPFDVKIGDVKLGQTKIEHLSYPGAIPPEDTIEGIRQIFSNFFGEAFEDAGFDPNLFFGSKATIRDGVLFSKPAKFKGIESTWGVFFDWLVLHFAGADLETLRSAWRGEKTLTEPNQTTENTSAKGLIQQCFGVQKVDGKTIAYFNYKRLYEFLFPPTINITPQDDHKTYKIEIDKSHLMTYMKQLNEGGVLLNVFRPDEHSAPLVQPLFIGLEETVEKPSLYVLMVDRSASMNDHFSSLKNYVLEFAHKLRQENPTANLRIAFFDDAIGPIQDFKIKDEAAITKFLKDTPLGRNTNIFGTVATELEKSFVHSDSQNVVLMLFTDGVDNSNGEKEKELLNEQIAVNAKKANAPQFHTFGFGNYDHQTLSELALKMHGSFAHLTSFDQLSKALKTTGYHTKKSRILVDLRVLFGDEKTNGYKIPLYADGGTQAPDLFIPLTDSSVAFQVNGQNMVVTVPDASRIPLATTLDSLSVIASKARHLVANRALFIRDKMSQLLRLLMQLDQLHVETAVEKEVMAMVEKELKDYHYALDIHSGNLAALESIYTRAELRTNLIKTEGDDFSFEQQQVYANGPDEACSNPLLGVEIISHHNERGDSVVQQAISFQAARSLHRVVNDAVEGVNVLCEQAFSPADPVSTTASELSEDSLDHYSDSTKMPPDEILFDHGDWDPEIATHPDTGEPIFRYSVYRLGVEVGSMYFYGYRGLCRSEEGEGHNIIALEGELADFDIKGKLHRVEDICALLPPTLVDQLTNKAYKGAEQGGIRGLSKVISYALDVKGFSKKISQGAQAVVYYGGMFTLQYANNYNALASQDISETEKMTNAAYQAMWDTGSLAVTHMVLNRGSQLLGWVGEKVCQSGWRGIGGSLQSLAGYGSYGAYAYQSYTQGPVAAAVSVVAGVAAEKAVEKTGRYAVDRFFRPAPVEGTEPERFNIESVPHDPVEEFSSVSGLRQ